MFVEHVNLTVTDARRSADFYEQAFGWHTRWEGESMGGLGYTVHVGDDGSYLTLYHRLGTAEGPSAFVYDDAQVGLNHVGVVVDDLDAVHARLVAVGVETFSHSDYEPGRRFYFNDPDGIEIEVVSYAG